MELFTSPIHTKNIARMCVFDNFVRVRSKCNVEMYGVNNRAHLFKRIELFENMSIYIY